MGIDIYLTWDGITPEEEKKQITGFSIQHGHVGYLREAYHGGPYATKVLVPEAFEDDAEISADVLESRLPAALQAYTDRCWKIYKEVVDENDPGVKSFRDFVALARTKETQTGKPCRVHASY
jgi:hypothetical protein